jgi:hypothetical protein
VRIIPPGGVPDQRAGSLRALAKKSEIHGLGGSRAGYALEDWTYVQSWGPVLKSSLREE